MFYRVPGGNTSKLNGAISAESYEIASEMNLKNNWPM